MIDESGDGTENLIIPHFKDVERASKNFARTNNLGASPSLACLIRNSTLVHPHGMMAHEMKLDVLKSTAQPWYADGLNFTCQQCGNCCTGAPGYVWITNEEVSLMAGHLRMSPQDLIAKYCRTIDGRISLRERHRSNGNYDCIFLKEQKVPREGDKVVLTQRVCAVYPVRPLQCRTWPFWDSNLQSESRWKSAAKGCPGINQGRKFSIEQIVELRDAKSWPKKPPTSA